MALLYEGKFKCIETFGWGLIALGPVRALGWSLVAGFLVGLGFFCCRKHISVEVLAFGGETKPSFETEGSPCMGLCMR